MDPKKITGNTARRLRDACSGQKKQRQDTIPWGLRGKKALEAARPAADPFLVECLVKAKVEGRPYLWKYMKVAAAERASHEALLCAIDEDEPFGNGLPLSLDEILARVRPIHYPQIFRGTFPSDSPRRMGFSSRGELVLQRQPARLNLAWGVARLSAQAPGMQPNDIEG